MSVNAASFRRFLVTIVKLLRTAFYRTPFVAVSKGRKSHFYTHLYINGLYINLCINLYINLYI